MAHRDSSQLLHTERGSESQIPAPPSGRKRWRQKSPHSGTTEGQGWGSPSPGCPWPIALGHSHLPRPSVSLVSAESWLFPGQGLRTEEWPIPLIQSSGPARTHALPRGARGVLTSMLADTPSLPTHLCLLHTELLCSQMGRRPLSLQPGRASGTHARCLPNTHDTTGATTHELRAATAHPAAPTPRQDRPTVQKPPWGYMTPPAEPGTIHCPSQADLVSAGGQRPELRSPHSVERTVGNCSTRALPMPPLGLTYANMTGEPECPHHLLCCQGPEASGEGARQRQE